MSGNCLEGMTRRNGEGCGNPGLQAGGAVRNHAVWRTALAWKAGHLPVQWSRWPPCGGAVLQTGFPWWGLPGLKAGVTADVAFQAGCTGFPDMRYGCRRSPCQRWITPGSPAAIDREDRFTRQVKGAVNMLLVKNVTIILIF